MPTTESNRKASIEKIQTTLMPLKKTTLSAYKSSAQMSRNGNKNGSTTKITSSPSTTTTRTTTTRTTPTTTYSPRIPSPSPSPSSNSSGQEIEECKVFEMDPFDPSIKSYFKRDPDPNPCPPIRNFVWTKRNSIWLEVEYRKEVVAQGRKCFYTIIEGQKKIGEDEEKPGKPIEFDPNMELVVNASFVIIDCRIEKETKNGKNTFSVTLPYRPPEMAARKEKLWNDTLAKLRPSGAKPPAPRFSVHMIGFDSASAQNARRQLGSIRSLLLDELNATEFLIYNKVGKNTFPNWAALHTGWSLEFEEKTKIRKPRIWKDFSDKGFWTIYAEDWDLTGWAINAKGFPFDYRYRVPAKGIASVDKASDKVFSMYSWECFNGLRNLDIKLDWFSNFLDTHRNYSQDTLFSFIWETHLTHDHLNHLRFCDEPYSKLMRKMQRDGHLNNSVLIFFSDHGLRFGAFPQTDIGDKENNLPFLYIAFPKWFHEMFPELVNNVRKNSRKLTTHYDLRKTLLHLLHLQTNTTPWENDFKDGSQTSYSLMTDEIPRGRTCEEAGIPEAFCSCYTLTDLDANSEAALHAGTEFVKHLNKALVNVSDICAELIFHKVEKARKIEGKDKYKLHVKTLPVGLFEGWIEFKHGLTATPSGREKKQKGGHDHNSIVDLQIKEVARLDSYKDTSYCVWKTHVALKELCYCKVQKP